MPDNIETHVEISKDQADAIVASKTAPMVTKADVAASFMAYKYFVEGTTTVCIATMRNGYRLIGSSGVASPENFDEEVGKTYAREDCHRQAWPLLGFALRQRLWEETSFKMQQQSTEVGKVGSGPPNQGDAALGAAQASDPGPANRTLQAPKPSSALANSTMAGG